MKYREIEYLVKTTEVQCFVDKYELKLKVVDNQKIYLISKCMVFEIYGFVVEDFFYFDLYTIDLKYNSTLNRLLSDIDSKLLRTIYEQEVAKRKQVLIPHLQISQLPSNREFTLTAEQYFFSMLRLMDELLSDVLLCKQKIDDKHFSEIFDFKKKKLEQILLEK